MAVRSDYAKIRNPAVRILAEEGSEDIVNVLIELDIARPAMVAQPSAITPGRTVFVPGAAVASSEEFKQFGGFLEQVGVNAVHPLEVANAYSVTLQASQLPAVIAHPLVIHIDDNVRHY